MFSLGFALMGYIDRPLNIPERALLLVASGLVLTPFQACIAAGAAILAGDRLFSQKRGGKTGTSTTTQTEGEPGTNSEF